MTLFTPKGSSKEGFNALIRQNNGGSDEVSEQIIYNVGYLVYCSNIYALRQLKSYQDKIQNLLADKMILKNKLSELEQELIKLKSKQSQRRDA